MPNPNEPNPGQQPPATPGAPGTPTPGEETYRLTIDGKEVELPKSKVLEYASKGKASEDAFHDRKEMERQIGELGGMEEIRAAKELKALFDSDPELAATVAEMIEKKYAEPEAGKPGEAGKALATPETVAQMVAREMDVREGQREMAQAFTELHKSYDFFKPEDEQKVIDYGARNGIWNVTVAFERMHKEKLDAIQEKAVRDKVVQSVKEGRDLADLGTTPAGPVTPPDPTNLSTEQLIDAIEQDAKSGGLLKK